MAADALSIRVIEQGPVRAFEFETFMFQHFPLRLICPTTRENLMMSAAQCAVGAVLRFRSKQRQVLVQYLARKPAEQ